MRKLLVVLTCLLCGSTASLRAQIARLQEREAEWKSYSLPKTDFIRQVTPDQTLVFRVPADWKQEGTELTFVGPHSARITVTPGTVPDGYPLTEYVAAVLKATEDQLGSSEDILTRRTQFQDLEAREIYLESPDDEGTMFRSTTWITISGPLVVRMSIIVPVEHATALEPFFKATVQSVMVVPANFRYFEARRLDALKTPAGGPIHEIENIVASLNELNSDREAAINRLTPIFISRPDTVVDLLVDRRVAVRSAAVEALARSKNPALKLFLWHVLDDGDPFVAEAAARRLATETDIVSQLLNRSWTTNATEIVARVWPFMSKENRIKFLQDHFNQSLPDRNVQTGSLLLMYTLRPEEFKLPLARILAAKNDPFTTVALRVANDRGEALPVDSLIKLAGSPDQKIRRLAVESLGQSAALSDIPRLEALKSKTPVPAGAKDDDALARRALDEEIDLSVKKIRLRNDLGLAKSMEEGRAIIRKATSDSSLANFAWRFDCEITDAGCAPATTTRNLPADFKIKPFAENLFPQKITHYTAIPNPAQAVQRFYGTLHGLQLDSPRAQASLILVMGSLREKLGRELGAPPDAPALIDYTGIKPDSPIVFGSWTAAGARDSVALAQRRAIVLRVKDRERFERLLDDFQKATGYVTLLTDYVGMGTRAAAALPALLPFSAQAVISADPDKPARIPNLSYSIVGQTEWNGIPIKMIEHRWLNSQWELEVASTYLAFIGDAAIMTSNVATIRDLLSNATTAEQQLLAGNEEFRQAVETDGDIVYFSDLKAVFADANDKSLEEIKKANESGSLKFATSSWENSHRFVFDESEWSKPLMPFHPKELSAARELLPSSTLAYFMMKLDIADAWAKWPKTTLGDNRFALDPASWSLDFHKEVLPELGPECGVALLELPGYIGKTFDGGTWAGYCKLRSNKLSDAFAAGKLFHGVGPTTETAEVKSGETSYFVGIRNGFLVVSNNSKGLPALASKTKLADARDYSRAAEKIPAGIVAFGGYNLEAAIAVASATAGDGLRAQVAAMVFSVASAFHSQSFYATAATAGAIEGRSSVAMDREGRYAVADFNYIPRGANITFATLQPHGMPILDQQRLSNIVLKVRAKAPGPIDSIRDDIKSATQTVEQKSANELVVTVAARRRVSEKNIQLPITNPDVAAFVKATGEITSDDKNVIEQARQIAGDDRDAWSVAQKLAEWTHKNLEWKIVARAGAAETLATREADCSEFSQLFVSMARSLGLPARIVSGLAYSGNSFGGHAWVEVWIGEWIELDPTWGTHFVDATHIRNETSTLVTAAALNLIDLEVLETRRTVADFQKNAKAFVEHFAEAAVLKSDSEIEAMLDLPTLTDEFMGPGAWSKLNENERSQVSSAYRRMVNRIMEDYGDGGTGSVHVLQFEQKGDRAEALCFVSDTDYLIKLLLQRRDDLWYLIDIMQPDPGFHLAAEMFGAVKKSIEANRAGKKITQAPVSEFLKVVALTDSDPKKAVVEAERLLQTKPADQTYRYLKILALWATEENDDEYAKLLTELGNEQPAFPPAVYELAGYLSESNPEQSIELYKRYSSLEPNDPRGYRDLGAVYETTKQTELAEAAYRKAIAVDPHEIFLYEDLAIFLIRNGRVDEVSAVLVAADKYADEEWLLFSVLSELEDDIKLEDAQRLATNEARRLEKSSSANLALSDIYIREKRYREAVDLIKRAVQIEPKSAYAHISLAAVYLKQARLNEALKTVDYALTLHETSVSGHYIRASVLARLGRKKDAMAALEKSIELDSGALMWITDDEDFKSLRTLPAFKKLLEDAKKQAQAAEPK